MISFLFWNLARKPLQERLYNLTVNYNIDVLILAEMEFAPDQLLSTLNKNQTRYEYAANIGCEKIDIFTRFDSSFLELVRETDRVTIRRLALPGTMDVLLAAVHLPSKQHSSRADQTAYVIRLADEILKAEEQMGHNRTILVGDLNMNPFDEGVVTAMGLHGVMDKDIARRSSRTIQNCTYPFFYNPMWNLFGDQNGHPSGTFYFSREQHVGYFWHMLDQVLIRPSLIDVFDISNLEIVQTDGSVSFLKSNGRPDTRIASDHLPIRFMLNL